MLSVKSYEALQAEFEKLKLQLQEANETIDAIRSGEVDALVVNNGKEHQLYTLKSADQTYRVFIEKIITPELTCIFADAINRYRLNNGLLRAIFLWRCWSEYGNAAGPVYF